MYPAPESGSLLPHGTGAEFCSQQFRPNSNCLRSTYVGKRVRRALFRLTAPSEDEVRHFIAGQRDSRFSYLEVGASAGDIPARYNVDHNRIHLGKGEVTWRRAVAAIRGWQMF